MSKHVMANVDGFVKRGGEIYIVDPKSIVADRTKNIRDSYGEDQDDLSLKEWIRENGSLNLPPLKVQKIKTSTGFEMLLRDGYRRHWAMTELISEGVDLVQVRVEVVDSRMTDVDALFYAVSTGQGKRPSPLELARTFQRLKDYGHSIETISKKVGMPVSTVYEIIRLDKASPETRQAIKSGSVGVGTASRAISKSGGDADGQRKAIKKATAPKVKVSFNKKSNCMRIKWDSDTDRNPVVNEIFSNDNLQKLRSAGLDVETIKFSIALKTQ